MVWMVLGGIAFAALNTVSRLVAPLMTPVEVRVPRYFSYLIVMIPFIARTGRKAFAPNGAAGQVWRGAFQTGAAIRGAATWVARREAPLRWHLSRAMSESHGG